ncbi:MAG TPA: hypothetical protein VHE30_14575 [Polyangiaceae bacterium]|nr:hypothetical protein [Polyangiaceae bacterium]
MIVRPIAASTLVVLLGATVAQAEESSEASKRGPNAAGDPAAPKEGGANESAKGDEKKPEEKKPEAPPVDEKSVDHASASEKKIAGDLYTQAMTAFDKGDLAPALEGFRSSYSHVKSPNSHFMIARTLARQGNNAEAYAELDRVIDEAEALGSRYADTARAAREKQSEIRPRIGFLTVVLEDAPKDTEVTVAGERLPKEKIGKAVPVLPGDTKVTATPPGGATQSFSKNVPAGDTETLTVELGPQKSGDAEEPDYHPRYLVEASLHLAGETLEPPGNATRGAGPGGRVALEFSRTGVLGAADSFAVVGGVDWIGTSTDAHYWIPVALQWNVWMMRDVSLFFEPGVALLVGAGTKGSPVLDFGLRYRVWKKVSVVGRIGIPGATIGASILL